MFVDKPRLGLALSVFWLFCLGSLYYILYSKHQSVAACEVQSGLMRRIDAQSAQTETQLDAAEARLDAAEAQLDKAR
jgi:hypothetical protein